ncbi:NUDIX domain-containing protein [Aquabacterium sp. A08]|uniref:NUDIX hydrolase n=1 Tax=Aquabacterium sp. A08 TaxID=2718532 RepID=UPI001421039B|nr:NUDIX domain-containing protein [Aquabacterium sp. A08]NIC41344.1 NUDIX domain-containing protein [Aquabacterium sp. A08]NIC41351.1 NUDIX domain-containing protein [Aquabacterium sp. A08]
MTVAPPAPAPVDAAASDTPRPAASVVLLRDGADGLEVLLLRRHQNSGVLGGWYVFPGGKLDPADHGPGWDGALDLPPAALHERLAEPDTPAATALGLHVAALREMHEEAGVLLTEAAPGAAPADPQRLRTGLQAGTPWPQALAAAGLRWRTRALQPWSRWITPRNPPVGTPRFDTRFFLALLPPGQQAAHDNHEATETLWLTPRAGLARYWAGEIGLIPPQLMALAQLARHPDCASAWAEAQTRRPPCIQPEHFMDGPHRAMCYPGDPRHSVAGRALPGPTRLRLVAQRFEPFDGYEGWFA